MVVLGLGSNVGVREDFLRAAVKELRNVLGNMRVSRVLESDALPSQEPLPGSDRAFLNMAVRGDSALAPRELLGAIKGIEDTLGRVKRCVWGPREIDIDILAMDGLVFQEDGLVIPHPELVNRDFALVPLWELAPEWFYPGEGEFKGRMVGEIILARGYAFNGALRETGIRVDD